MAKTLSDFTDKYFLFGINCPPVFQEAGDYYAYGLFQVQRGLFVPRGDRTKTFVNLVGNYMADEKEIVEDMRGLGIEEVFTTCLRDHPNEELGGLINECAPEDWDYEVDPYPEAIIYYSIEENYFERHGINIIKADFS